MTKEDIDEIFKIMEYDESDFYLDDYRREYNSLDLWEIKQDYRYKKLLRFSRKHSKSNEDLGVDKEFYFKLFEVYTDILAQIEENPELFEYFKSKRGENREIYGELLVYTEKHSNDIEEFLRECIYESTSTNIISALIRVLEDNKKFLFSNQDYIEISEELSVGNIVKGLENIEDFLISENVENANVSSYDFMQLIIETGNIKKYLTIDNIDRFRLEKRDIITLLEKVDNIDEILTPEFALKSELEYYEISRLIKNKSLNVERYKIKKNEDKFNMTNLIFASGKIEEYLDSENFNDYKLPIDDVIRLIIKTNNVKKYLIPEYLIKFGIDSFYIADLACKLPTKEFEKFLLESQKDETFPNINMANVIKGTGNIEKYLNIENVIKYNLSPEIIRQLIIEAKLEEKYKIDLQDNNEDKAFLIDILINQSNKISENIKSKKEKINLPNEMTIGIEIETMGPASYYIMENYANIGENGFESGGDLSLQDEKYSAQIEGVEIKSPILTGDFEKASELIKKVCGKLNTMRSNSK